MIDAFSIFFTHHNSFVMCNQTKTQSIGRKKVGCVGKGLLFDTGGYNIKTSMVS
jgi:leucyl aminopeptidase